MRTKRATSKAVKADYEALKERGFANSDSPITLPCGHNAPSSFLEYGEAPTAFKLRACSSASCKWSGQLRYTPANKRLIFFATPKKDKKPMLKAIAQVAVLAGAAGVAVVNIPAISNMWAETDLEKAKSALEEAQVRLQTYEAMTEAKAAQSEYQALEDKAQAVIDEVVKLHPELVHFVMERTDGNAFLAADLLKTLGD